MIGQSTQTVKKISQNFAVRGNTYKQLVNAL